MVDGVAVSEIWPVTAVDVTAVDTIDDVSVDDTVDDKGVVEGPGVAVVKIELKSDWALLSVLLMLSARSAGTVPPALVIAVSAALKIDAES